LFYQQPFRNRLTKNVSQSVGHDWEVVERHIAGQKSYEKVDNVSVIAEEDENLEHTKPGTHRFITNFLEGRIKNKKIEKLL
jgi:hypothetical protein